MNIFELSAVASPIAGAVAGGLAAKGHGAVWLMLGIVVGLLIGVALYFAAIGLSALLARVCTSQKLNPLQWMASFSAVLLPAASPFAAWALSVFAVARIMHL